MLEELSVRGFKSLQDVGGVRLPRISVLLGPNAAHSLKAFIDELGLS